VNEPKPEPGFVCFYRGANFGFKESEDSNAAFFNFASPEGLEQSTPTAKNGARIGELILFRTGEFEAETPIAEILKPAFMSAAGSWAVTAKE
jgi:hypothetical protein